MNTKVSDAQKHSAAHVLAMAVSRLYKNVKIGIGPVTKEGYYYDFDLDQKIKIEDLPRIEGEMNKIIQENLKFQQIYLQREQALNLLLQKGQIYKAELVKSLPDQEVSFFKTGEEFLDLCRGPHVSSTNQIGVIALTRIENSYWEDNPSRPQMLRIFGKAFKSIEDLIEYKKLQEDLKEKNYQNLSSKYHYGVLDKESDLVLTERGTSIHKKIEGVFNSTFGKRNFKEIILTKSYSNELELDSVFSTLVKFNNSSYRDFPYRYFLKANLSSLSFTRSIKKLHISSFRYLNRESDLIQDFTNQFENLIEAFKRFKLDFTADIFANDFEESFAKQISNLLQRKIISHNKIIKNTDDIYVFIKVVDKYEKEWVLADLKIHTLKDQPITSTHFNIYTTEIWKYIIEAFEGIMPDYLNPIDIVCIPIGKYYYEYAQEVVNTLNSKGFNAIVNNRAKSMNKKIRDAENLKIPFQIIVGQKEQASASVSLREDGADTGLINLESLIIKINEKLKRS
jgi:threonyl-tRNA synthetase